MEQTEKNQYQVKDDQTSAVNNAEAGLYDDQQVIASVRQDAHPKKEGNPFLSVDPGMYIWTVVTFFILLAILGKFAWRPILKALDEREQFISKSLEDAEKAKRELEEITQRQAELIAQARDQAKEIVSKGKEAAERIAKDIEDRAKAESNKLLLNAKREIEQEKSRAISLLRMETTDLVIKAASHLINSDLDSEKSRKLVDETIKELAG